jgi:hypothetical protein
VLGGKHSKKQDQFPRVSLELSDSSFAITDYPMILPGDGEQVLPPHQRPILKEFKIRDILSARIDPNNE